MKPLPEYLQDIFDFYSFAVAFTIRRHRDVPERSYGDILENETLFRWLFRTTKMDLSETPPVMSPFLEAADAARDDVQFRQNMESLRQKMAEYITRIHPGIPEQHPLYQPGCCLRFEQGTSPDICHFHMFNGIAPRSFLADTSYFFGELERIMDGAEQCGCNTLVTTTWLNSNPRFLALFPREWSDNLGEPSDELQNNLGFHGQFVMADGSLNRKAADYFLEHGRLKYRPRASHCSFASVRQHIRERRNTAE